MSDFNDDLDKALEVLYNYSKTFRLSIDLIQKLSQQLKLDTFIDTDAYSHILDQPLKDSNGSIIKFQRLSIAGSLILIDVDFADSSIHRVAFSSANQLDTLNPSDSILLDNEPEFKLPNIEDQDDLKIINLEFNSKSVNSLLNSGKIENLLLQNLQQPLLNEFPNNLKYLANLDRLSTSQTDLFSYIDNLGLLLTSLYHIEVDGIPDDNWPFRRGFLNSIGKISFNIPNQIGIFIEYWQDFKHINYENESKDGSFIGKKYNVLLDVNTRHFSSPVDYIGEARDQIWNINDNKYQFNFLDESYLVASRTTSSNTSSNMNNNTSKFLPNWDLSLNLNHAIYLPINLLEFIGVNYYEEAASIKENKFFEKLNDEKEVGLINEDLKITIKSDVHSKFSPIKLITIKRLIDIPSFLTIFRNQLMLTNLLSQLITNCQENKGSTSVNDNIKNTLKKSLKLSNDVTDDQIFSLNSLSTFKDDNISLDEFLKESSPAEELNTDDLVIKINDISYNKGHGISVSIKGKLNKPINIQFEILNGQLKSTTDMVDDDEVSFLKALEYSEDFIKSLKSIY